MTVSKAMADQNAAIPHLSKGEIADLRSDVDAAFALVEVVTSKMSLTVAQIKALRATPVSLVAAPGAGKVLQFMSALLKLTAGTEVLAEDVGGSNLRVKYTNGSGVAVSDIIEATGFIDQLADTYTSTVPVKDAIVAATGAENQALVLHNIGAGEIVGNASDDAAMDVYVSYKVLTV